MAKYQLISNCTVKDAAGLARNNMSAFYTATWWRALWPNKSLEDLIAATTKRTPNNLLRERDLRRHQKVIDSTTGEIVGYARWFLPESHAGDWLEAQVPGVSDEDKERYSKDFAETDFYHRNDMDELDPPVWEKMNKHAPEKYLKLDYMAVRPENHRDGVGSLLLRSGIEQADKMGLDIYLVAMGVEALNMYKKSGFELLDELSQSLEPWGYDDVYDTYILIKRPSARATLNGERE